MCAERGLAISQADREWLVLFALLRNKPAGGRCELASHQVSRDNAPARWVTNALNGGSVGSPATLLCLPGQVRKEAAKADDACAGM